MVRKCVREVAAHAVEENASGRTSGAKAVWGSEWTVDRWKNQNACISGRSDSWLRALDESEQMNAASQRLVGVLV
jgi:hypothetical protein